MDLKRRGIMQAMVLSALVPLASGATRAPKHHGSSVAGLQEDYAVGDTVDIAPGGKFICVVPGRKCMVIFGDLEGRALLVPVPKR